jgi:TonB family protein
VLIGVGVALLLHGVALFSLRFIDFDAPLAAMSARLAAQTGPGSDDDRPMEITTIEDTLRHPDAPTPEEKRAEAQKKKDETTRQKGQYVDLARPAIEERPDEARFLSEYDSKVDHEKKGPTGRDKAGAKAESTPVPSSPPPGAQAASDAARGGRAGTPGEARPVLAMVHPRSTGHDGHEVADDGELHRKTGIGDGPERAAVPKPAGALKQMTGDGGEGGDGKPAAPGAQAGGGKPNLAPSRELLERAIGAGPGSMDYLKNIDDGDATALNSKKDQFAPFFNRMKRQIQQEWHPDVVYVQHDPSGNVYGVKDRVSVLRVHLKPDGSLISTEVLQPSGIDFLDDEAVAAFKKAGTFINPPKGLVDPDGQIHFNFAFVFALSGRTSFKVYKYK